MRSRPSSMPRRGQIVVLTGVMMFAMCGMLALALDIGMMAIARNQCQAAADMAAMAGARGLNGYNNPASVATAQADATAVATMNTVLTQKIGMVNLTFTNGAQVGLYCYNPNRLDCHGDPSPGFSLFWNPNIDGATSAPVNPYTLLDDNYTAVQVGISFSPTQGSAFTTSAFGKMAGLSAYNSGALATSAHVPRDLVIIQDYSTSMRYDSMLAMPKDMGRFQSMLNDANVPQFGNYSDIAGAALSAYGSTASTNTSAANGQSSYPPTPPSNYAPATLNGLVMSGTSSAPTPLFLNDTGELCNPGNLTATTGDGPSVASYYYQNPIGTTSPALAFSSASTSGTPVPGTFWPVNYVFSTTGSTPPNADNFLFSNLNTQPSQTATTVPSYAAVVNSTATTNVPSMLLPSNKIYCGQQSSAVPSKGAGNGTSITSNGPGTANDYFDLTWELDGYAGYYNGVASNVSGHPLNTGTSADYTYQNLPFHGYIQGPSYWGVSFFTWPPDPRVDPVAVLNSGNATAIKNYNLNCALIIQAIFNYTPTPTSISNTSSDPANGTWVQGLYNAANGNSNVKGWSGWTKGVVGTTNGFTDWLAKGYSTSDIVNYLTSSGTGLPGLTATDPRIAQVCRLFNRGQPAGGTATISGSTGSYSGTSTAPANFSADWRARFFYAADAKTPLTTNSALWNSSGAWQPPWSNSGNVNYVINYNALMAWLNNLQGGTAGAANTPLSSSSISPANPTGFSTQLHGGGIQYYGSIPQATTNGAWSAPFTTLSSMSFPSSGDNPGNGDHITGGNTDEMFWLEYINETLGLIAVSDGNNHNNQNFFYTVLVDNAGATGPASGSNKPYTGIGNDWTWTGTSNSLSSAPSSWSSGSATPSLSQYGGLYMSHSDNPPRPKSKFWFGPMTMLDMMGNVNMGRYWFSGNCTEAPSFQCKLGVQAALNEIKVNHPNDCVGLCFFGGGGGFNNMVACPLGRQYVYMDNAEWFSPATINSGTTPITSLNSTAQANGEFTPYDDGLMNSVPRANGGTCYAQALMLAYNQFSSYTPLQTAYGAKGSPYYLFGGGNGRSGSTKLLIVESDGVNKDGAAATLTAGGGSLTSGSGNGQQYYNGGNPSGWSPAGSSLFNSFGGTGSATEIGDPGTVVQSFPAGDGRVKWSVNYTSGTLPNPSPMSDSLNVVSTLCSDVAYQGYSTQRKPVLAHCLAFGSLFNPVSTNPYTPSTETNAPAICLQMMHNIEVMGSIQPVSGSATPNGIATSKIITGPWNQTSPPGRVQLMQAAFQAILQDGLEIALVCSSATPGKSN